MTAARQGVVLVGAALCTVGVVAIILTSEREDASIAWAVLGPIVVWSFVGTGLYATQRRPGSRVGLLMVALGFAWCVAAISLANSAFAFSLGLVVGGLWGAVFLHLILSFPTGRLAPGTDRPGCSRSAPSRRCSFRGRRTWPATTAPRTSGWSSATRTSRTA